MDSSLHFLGEFLDECLGLDGLVGGEVELNPNQPELLAPVAQPLDAGGGDLWGHGCRGRSPVWFRLL